jgi:hypothetical protein
MPYLSSGSDQFQKASITKYNLVDDILTSTPASGWTIETGMTEGTTVTLNFYMVNRMQALNKVLREMSSYYVLFNSSTKKVKWLNATTANVDRSASNMAYDTKTLVKTSMLRDISQIVVIGKDSTIRGEYGSSTSSRAYYQVNDITTDTEALAIATAIHADIGVSYDTYRVVVDPTHIEYDVRDKVKVNGSIFYIREIIQGMDEIALIVDTGKISVIDSLGSRIKKIEGDFPTGSDGSWNGGSQNVSNDGALVNQFIFNCKDATMISNFKLKFKIAKWKASTADSTLYLSNVSQVIAAADDAVGSGLTVGTHYYPDSTGMNCCANGGSYMNGYQFGHASALLYVLSTGSCTNSVIELQIQNGATGWQTVDTTDYYSTGGSAITQLSLSGLFSGWVTQEDASNLVRARLVFTIGSGDGGYLRPYKWQIRIGRVTRHIHELTLETGEPDTSIPTYINYMLNGVDWYRWSEATGEIDYTPVTGENIIYVRCDGWPAPDGGRANVTVTGTYQVLGKS